MPQPVVLLKHIFVSMWDGRGRGVYVGMLLFGILFSAGRLAYIWGAFNGGFYSALI